MEYRSETGAAHQPGTGPDAGVRAANRARNEREILGAAARQLATRGVAGLTLRGVAAEVGLAPSAIYRYYPGRDALLTALIIDAYNDVGAAARSTMAETAGQPAEDRVLAACRAVRDWARANPQRYALIYGTPLPDYTAPEDTIGPASEVGRVLAEILASGDAARSRPAGPGWTHTPADPPVSAETAESLSLPPGAAVAAIRLWTALFGMVSFELYGHWHNVVSDPDAFFRQEILHLAGEVTAALAHGT